VSGRTIEEELENIWKEVIMAYIEVYTEILQQEISKNQ
jgi:hypothetical protein